MSQREGSPQCHVSRGRLLLTAMSQGGGGPHTAMSQRRGAPSVPCFKGEEEAPSLPCLKREEAPCLKGRRPPHSHISKGGGPLTAMSQGEEAPSLPCRKGRRLPLIAWSKEQHCIDTFSREGHLPSCEINRWSDEAELTLLLLAEHRAVLTEHHPLSIKEEPPATYLPGGHLGGRGGRKEQGQKVRREGEGGNRFIVHNISCIYLGTRRKTDSSTNDRQ